MSNFDPSKFDWINPDYKEVFEFRLDALSRLRKNPGALDKLMDYY